jgi:hypothetical protein
VHTGNTGAVILARLGDTKTFFFFLGRNGCGNKREGHQGCGSSSDHGTLVHLEHS